MNPYNLDIFGGVESPPQKIKKTPNRKIPPERIWENKYYLPGISAALSAHYNLLTTDDLIELQYKQVPLYFDIECYCNYFLIAFSEPLSGKCLLFEILDNEIIERDKLKWVMTNFQLIGFNSNNYDIPMATLATTPHLCNPSTLKQASDMIIMQNLRPRDIYMEFQIKSFPVDSIDIINLLPLEGSLKVYSGRIHAPKLQDLPFPPHNTLTYEQKLIVRHYCMNDLLDTVLLTTAVKPQLELRCVMSMQYGIDLRSHSDAQIAENIIHKLVNDKADTFITRPNIEVGRAYKYNIPSFLKFKSNLMQTVLSVVKDSQFIVGENGRIGLPLKLSSLNIVINKCTYQLGIGGLHSKEKCSAYQATNEMIIRDRDVTSYYPMIILNQNLAPKNMGKHFSNVYRRIVNERIDAKHRGNKVIAECQKIIINSSFGKMGNQYSYLYSPQLIIQITVTGQLALLMLIETLELAGIEVVSGNTDGIVIYTHKHNEVKLNAIVHEWENITGFKTEETIYKAIYSRDYIAIKEDNSVKLKGAYRLKDISKNPVNEVCINAVVNFLTMGTSMEEWVTTCIDIRDFLTLRVVRGGAFKDGEFLGKTVRWYKSTNCPGPISYAKSGNDVPLTNGCRALQELPDVMPTDVDYNWYIKNCYAILEDIGYLRDPATPA
jgi:hypothetical protein